MFANILNDGFSVWCIHVFEALVGSGIIGLTVCFLDGYWDKKHGRCNGNIDPESERWLK